VLVWNLLIKMPPISAKFLNDDFAEGRSCEAQTELPITTGFSSIPGGGTLRFSLPYLWPDQKLYTLFMTSLFLLLALSSLRSRR